MGKHLNKETTNQSDEIWNREEPADRKQFMTILVNETLVECGVPYTHLFAMSPFRRRKQIRGSAQRNRGIEWIRNHPVPRNEKAIVFFADDDNTYDPRIFKELEKACPIVKFCIIHLTLSVLFYYKLHKGIEAQIKPDISFENATLMCAIILYKIKKSGSPCWSLRLRNDLSELHFDHYASETTRAIERSCRQLHLT
ncbi:hypothetical protein ACTXT7_014531 [Hymenolepis weldensis]